MTTDGVTELRERAGAVGTGRQAHGFPVPGGPTTTAVLLTPVIPLIPVIPVIPLWDRPRKGACR